MSADTQGEHSPKIRPGQVWLCREHVETPEDCDGCGLTPYLPRFEVETLEAQLAGAVDLADEFEMLADACGHCLAAGRPPNEQMIENARRALAAFRGQ